ncbi:MAG: archaellum biogenesis protein FlaJ (TadC family) [Patescibacteria group bacterium]|jgi:archaellum biogenesis protein FlaJ (TadC family)
MNNAIRFFLGLLGAIVLIPIAFFLLVVIGGLAIPFLILAAVILALYAIASIFVFIFYAVRKEEPKKKTRHSNNHSMSQSKDAAQ